MNSTDILKILGIEVDQDDIVEVPRAKKRRLDHLTWDEKIQRKKLKNRVAAQTSRDRKKARIEQMETAITELCTRNDTLLTECENLKSLNEQLSRENAELRARLTEPCSSCKQKRSVGRESDEGSSDRVRHSSSSGFVQNSNSSENSSSLPSLPDLLDELDRDIDIESLEQLAESLLEDIARDLENAAQEADCQVSNIAESARPGSTGPVVGKTSENLEPSRSIVLSEEKEKSLENDISQYLLLHHNYTKPGPDPRELSKQKTKCKKEMKPIRTNTKLKKIIPKIPINVMNSRSILPKEPVQTMIKCKPVIEYPSVLTLKPNFKKVDTCVKKEPIPTVIKCEPVDNTVSLDQSLENTDVIYGTYDEATNCVTIVINEDGTSVTDSEEIVLTPENTVSSDFVNKYSNSLELPFSKIVNGGVSPMSCSGSDGGYESLGSPSHCENDWGEVSELFPSLM